MSNKNWQKAKSRDNVFSRGATTLGSSSNNRRHPNHPTLPGQFFSRKFTPAPNYNQAPNLLDLQLDLPDPINRMPYALVRGNSANRGNQGACNSAQHNHFSTSTTRSVQSAKAQLYSVSSQSLNSHRPAEVSGSAKHQQQEAIRNISWQHGSIMGVPGYSQLFRGNRENVSSLGGGLFLSECIDIPGIPIVFRSEEAKQLSSDKLSLESKRLTVMPMLQNEEQLQVLNLQNNMLSRIQHLETFSNLIFLELYDNLISEITGLDSLLNLRVLMLGKNRIKSISGLSNLTRLDVLDLHGNQIHEISNLSHLIQLRVLNLAGNEIGIVRNLENLISLTEINLRRNKVTCVKDFQPLTKLQRLFLAYNNINDLTCIQDALSAPSLHELTVDNNPIAHTNLYKARIISKCPSLRILDGVNTSEDDRKNFSLTLKKAEVKREEETRQQTIKAHRENTISNIINSWYKLHPQYINLDEAIKEVKEDSRLYSDSNATTSNIDYLYEIENDSIRLYGNKSIAYLDKTIPNGVNSLSFCYIDFDLLMIYFPKLHTKLPQLRKLELFHNNICDLNHINALGHLNGTLNELIVCHEGNPVTQSILFRPYVLFRLRELDLEILDNEAITQSEKNHASFLFSSLERVATLTSNTRLVKHLVEYNNKIFNINANSCLSPTISSGMNCLVYNPKTLSEVYPQCREKAKSSVQSALDKAISNQRRDYYFDQMWDRIFKESLENSIKDLDNLDLFCEEKLGLI